MYRESRRRRESRRSRESRGSRGSLERKSRHLRAEQKGAGPRRRARRGHRDAARRRRRRRGDGDRREAVRLDPAHARFRRGHAARHGVPVGRRAHRDVRLPSARRDGIGEGDRNRAWGDKVFAQANHRAAGGVQVSGKSPAA